MDIQGIKINDLPETYEIYEDDLFIVNQNNEAKVITNSNLSLGMKGDKGDPGDLIKVGTTFETGVETKIYFKLI